jgi:hypothetical protein
VIEIYRITDFAVAISILEDSVIKSEIYEDTAEFIVPDLVNEYWLAAAHRGIVLGCYRLHSMGAVLWQFHCRILPQHRRFAQPASLAFFKWCVENVKKLETIIGFVPKGFKRARMHAVRIGMKQVGTLPNSYLKDGHVIDQEVFAITKEKILCQQQP